MELSGKKISVLGMGRTGIPTANFLAARGAEVLLVDQKAPADLGEKLKDLSPRVQTKFGTSAPSADADLVVLSPGFDINSPLLDPARKRGIEIISEIELAYRFNTTPIIAVTGTNGKSTTTTLIGNILERAGKKVSVGGNIGIPFISLIDNNPKDFIVLEISTFQLEGIKQFKPHISVVLNISPDHLNRHKTMECYAELKGRIALNQTEDDFLVLNQDDPIVLDVGRDKRAKKNYFSTESIVEAGACLENNTLILRQGNTKETICPVDELKQVMQWQTENILAAAAATALAGVGANFIADTIKNFSGLEHRLEWVRKLRGIDFVNDSKGTNVGSVQKSLKSFDQPIILIAGGQDKGGDFSQLKSLFKTKVKHLVLIGEAKTKISKLLNGSPSYEEADTLEMAVKRAVSKAVAGDVILLSPACASFDMFKDYEDRGRQFKTIVNNL